MAAEKAEYGTEAAASGLPQLDLSTWASQILWLVITFGVLYFVLARFILPNIGKTISDRTDRIADDLDSASRMQRDAEEAEKSYEQALRDARAKAANVAETTKQSVDAEIQAELEAADREADAQAEAADKRLREIKAKALSNIDAVAEDLTSAIVAEMTGKAPTKATLAAALKKA